MFFATARMDENLEHVGGLGEGVGKKGSKVFLDTPEDIFE